MLARLAHWAEPSVADHGPEGLVSILEERDIDVDIDIDIDIAEGGYNNHVKRKAKGFQIRK
ncbi:uncharacterized protein EAE98_006270 [Botrytis deweyae]|uniref:Uncharacterized protein n=1 Tax=Botrytis deweyae TaxID=2478750 RepID=A0ABQ7IKE5_9HELO|nr:uncharacterized protein EAE98_006270 [Botrytis deweyae]KAF7926886.1 hypothetical protein EAE98_006270 [Botrytis deweyae]